MFFHKTVYITRISAFIGSFSAANARITEVVFGHQMDITSVTERYYFNENGFLRTKAAGLTLTDAMKNGTLYRAIEQADPICFIGDSVTEGTKNGGCPWYEPMEDKELRGRAFQLAAAPPGTRTEL